MQSIDRQIPCISSDGRGASIFSVRKIELTGSLDWMLSEQQSALNFRLRSSASGYQSDWHVAGDPTLLIILCGVIEIELRSGATKQFSVGEMFIAQDYLFDQSEFNDSHGHRARVVGQEGLQALHLKLEKQAR